MGLPCRLTAGAPAEPAALVAGPEARFASTATATDRDVPGNEHVAIADGKPVAKRLLKAHLAPAGVLEALADTEHRLNWTRHFGPASGFEAKLERPRERSAAAVFCYGCGLGPSQAARSLKCLDRRHAAHVDGRHMTEANLGDAITGVIDAYVRVSLSRHWGSGGSASADGKSGTCVRRA